MATSLQSLLKDAIARTGSTKQVESAQVVGTAQQLIGSLLPQGRSGDATVEYIKDGVLSVACAYGATVVYLKERTPHILNALKAKLPTITLYSIQFHVGNIHPPSQKL